MMKMSELDTADNSRSVSSEESIISEYSNLLPGDNTPTMGTYSKQLMLSVLVSCLTSLQYGYHMSELNAPELIYSCSKSVAGPMGDYEQSFFGKRGYPSCIPLSSNEVGMVTSIFSVGGLVGSIYAGLLADKYGRKIMFSLTALMFILGSSMETRVMGYHSMLIGRFVSGIAAGSGIVVTPLYINEVSPSVLRGTLGSMNQVSINIGILVTQLVLIKWANDEQWRWILLLGALIAFANFIGVFLIDESPKWLTLTGKDKLGFNALMKLRDNDIRCCKYEVDLWQNIRLDREELQMDPNSQEVNILQYLKSPEFRNSRNVVTLVMVGQQFCGINSIIFYGVKVLAALLPNSSVLINCLISVLNTVLTFGASFSIDKLGRKPILLTSVSMMLIASLVLGLGIIFNLSALSVASTIMYVGSFAIGLGPIPFLIIPEVSQNEVKGLAQSYGTTMNWLLTFLVGYLFPILSDAIGGGVYFIFSLICVLFATFTLYTIPETKGKNTYSEVWNLRDY